MVNYLVIFSVREYGYGRRVMSFKELTKYRMQLLKVLSEKEFSLDFHIFATEAVQDAQYISEEDAENVAKLIVDCVNAGDGEDEIIEKARFKVDYAKYVFGVKKALYGLGVEDGRVENLMSLYKEDLMNAFNHGWSAERVAENMNDDY